MNAYRVGPCAGVESLPSGPDRIVAIWKGDGCYSCEPVYHPSDRYPEYPFGNATGAANSAYEGVRASLKMLGLDGERFGTAAWNPLGELVRPGDRVLIKPNWIRQGHASRPDEWEQVVTHPSVVRAVLDYVYIALKGSGQVIVADGPQTDSDFNEICRRTSLGRIAAFFRDRNLEVTVLDLRREHWLQRRGVTYARRALPGDPLGYATVDLGPHSEFHDYALNGRFYGADYDVRETVSYHSPNCHRYVLCRSAMDADVIINLPKMKTHKKTGVTLSLKNIVGVNGHRNCLPHYTIGTPADGGDEFPDSGPANKAQSLAIAAFKRCLASTGGCGGRLFRCVLRCGEMAFGSTNCVIRSGNWHGNDTLWRTVLDLNKALFHFDGSGKPRASRVRYLTIVDGIVAGDGDGPSSPDRKEAGLVVAGLNPVVVDTACATLMGFDYLRIPLLASAWRIEAYPLVCFVPEQVLCQSNVPGWRGCLDDLRSAEHLEFRPYFGWSGHIEREAVRHQRSI